MAGACVVFKRNAAASDYKETPQSQWRNSENLKADRETIISSFANVGLFSPLQRAGEAYSLHPFYSNGLPHEEEVVNFLPHAVSKL